MSEISEAHDTVRHIRQYFRSSFTRAEIKRLTVPAYTYCLRLIAEKRAKRKLTSYWWLSFADDGKDGFRGACIVPAKSFLGAVSMAHVLKCNPGGQCLGVPIPKHIKPKPQDIGRIFNKAEAENYK